MTRWLAFAGVGAAWASALCAQSPTEEAWAHLRVGEYRDAIRGFRRAAEGGDIAAGRVWIRTLMEVGELEDAEREARRLNATRPPQFATVLGEVLYGRGRVADAEQAFREAAAATDSLTARLDLAVLRYERGEHDAAFREFDRFIDVYNRGRGLSAEDLLAVATAARYLGTRNFALTRDALRVFDEATAAQPANHEARLRAGLMLLERFNNTDASVDIQAILEVNPNHPRALLALARSRHFDGSSEALPTVERALELNENLAPARAFLASLYLELEEFDRAEREAQRALDVNPRSADALAVLAALRYLRGDRAGFASIERRALEANPRNATFFVTVAEVVARNRLYREAADFAARAVAADSNSWEAYAQLGVNQLRIGDIAAGRASLETAFRGDPTNPWTKNSLDLLDTFENYETVHSEHFELVLRRDESALMGLYIADLADEAYEALAARYGHRPPTPVRLEVYPRHADFSVRTVGLAGIGALGVSFGTVLAMDSPSARPPGEFHWGSTMWHEVAHAFHLTLSDHRVPRWFTEGCAVFEERRAHTGWGDDVSIPWLIAYRDNRLHAVSELNNGFVRPEYPEQVVFSYYLSSLVCEYIDREWGDGALVEMLRAFGRGLGTPDVFRTVLDVDVTDFDRTFDTYLRRRFAGALTAIDSPHLEAARGGPEAAASMTRLAARRPDDFIVQLGAGREALRAERFDEAAGYLERAVALFPEYAGEDSPYWYLAAAHEGRGDFRAAATVLDTLTRINAGFYRAFVERADALIRLADTAAAAAALDAAMFVYPLDLAQHRRLAAWHESRRGWDAAVRERRAVLALEPVDLPRAEYDLARTLFAAGQLAEARSAVLRALERAPNYEEALELLLEIRSRRDRERQ